MAPRLGPAGRSEDGGHEKQAMQGGWHDAKLRAKRRVAQGHWSEPALSFRVDMSDESKSSLARRALAIAVVVALLIAGYVLLARHTGHEPAAPTAGSGFRNALRKPGLRFGCISCRRSRASRSTSTCIDHGSGLAVGDYDNDGREDIYFLNQLGPNALYRNVG